MANFETMHATIEIPQEAKVWVYQSPVKFSSNQIELIEKELSQFTQSWEAHGTALKAYFQILDEQFILLAVDEKNQIATGCSIDKSVSIIKKLEGILGLNLTDKGLVAYETAEGIKTSDFRQLKEKVSSGELTPSTKIFNLSVSSFAEFNSNWKIEAQNSWVKRYFN